MTTPNELLGAIRAAAAAGDAGLAVAAEVYAGYGWPVFPLRPGAKVPLIPAAHPAGAPERQTCHGECGRAGHGCHDATTDLATVRAWWRRRPDANIGIATGAPGPDVVDIDTKHGAPGLASLEQIRAAGLVRGAHTLVVTASGGAHLYFVGSEQGNGSIRSRGVDFRGAGGYVVAAPSYVRTDDYAGRYRLDHHRASEATVDWSAIRRLFAPAQRTRQFPARTGGEQGHDSLVRWLTRQPEGGRNNALHWAACRALETDAGQDVLDALVAAAVGIGLPEQEARRTVESAMAKARAGALRGVGK